MAASTSADVCAEDSAPAIAVGMDSATVTTASSSSASTCAVPSVSASTSSSTVQLATVHWLPVSMEEKVKKLKHYLL